MARVGERAGYLPLACERRHEAHPVSRNVKAGPFPGARNNAGAALGLLRYVAGGSRSPACLLLDV